MMRAGFQRARAAARARTARWRCGCMRGQCHAMTRQGRHIGRHVGRRRTQRFGRRRRYRLAGSAASVCRASSVSSCSTSCPLA